MKKIFKRIAALLLVALVGVSSVACSLDELEQPEWLEQALCDHVFDEEEIIKEPTCVQNGKKTKICSSCGKTKITTIRATGEHVYDDGVQDNSVLTSTASWNERETAGGASVIDGSQAKLHKVVGNTVVVGKDENGMNGKIVNTSFGGIKSTSPNGEESLLEFSETELPLGSVIDFEDKKIYNYGVTIELTGDEQHWNIGGYQQGDKYYTALRSDNVLPSSDFVRKGIVTDGQISAAYDDGVWWIGAGSGNQVLYVLGAEQYFNLMTFADPNNPTEAEQNALKEIWRSYLRERYNSGNPVTLHYISATLQEETPFTDEMKLAVNEYQVWQGGTETVLGNDVPVGEISTSYVCGCTVCGQLKVDEETCNHELLTVNGSCFICGFDFSTAPTPTVNIGDELLGLEHKEYSSRKSRLKSNIRGDL